MKCGCKVVYKKYKNRRKPIPVVWITWEHEMRGIEVPPEAKVCDGTVVPEVVVESDGFCSCCSTPIIKVEYLCDKCSNRHFPELPNDNEFVNKALKEGLDEAFDREERKEALREAHQTLLKQMEDYKKREEVAKKKKRSESAKKAWKKRRRKA